MKFINYRLTVKYKLPMSLDSDIAILSEQKSTAMDTDLEKLKTLGARIKGTVTGDNGEVTSAYILGVDNHGNTKRVAWDGAV
jgi:hypothetical protein